MSTTDLFVEIIIIGIGGLIWLILLILSFLGHQWVPWDKAVSLTSLIPFLAITYILGIAVDRISDQIFSIWDKDLRRAQFSSNEEYHFARNYIYTYANEKIIDLFEYGKSRIRISRAWSINFILIAFSAILFISLNSNSLNLNNKASLLLVTVFGCFIGTASNLLAWRKLAKNDYKRLNEMFLFLKQEKK